MLYASVLPQCNHNGSDTDSIGLGKHSLALALTISKAVKKNPVLLFITLFVACISRSGEGEICFA